MAGLLTYSGTSDGTSKAQVLRARSEHCHALERCLSSR